jgi:hypothetical protein
MSLSLYWQNRNKTEADKREGGFDVEHHRTNNLVSRLDVLRVITALRDSRRLAAEEGDGPAYAEEIELCDKLAFQVRRLPNTPIQNQHQDAIGIVRELNKETFNRQVTKSRDEWVAQCEILNELESRLALATDRAVEPPTDAEAEAQSVELELSNAEIARELASKIVCTESQQELIAMLVEDVLTRSRPTVEEGE